MGEVVEPTFRSSVTRTRRRRGASLARDGCPHSRPRSRRRVGSRARRTSSPEACSRPCAAVRRADGTRRRAQARRPVGPDGRRDRVPARLGRWPGARAARGRRPELGAILLERIAPGRDADDARRRRRSQSLLARDSTCPTRRRSAPSTSTVARRLDQRRARRPRVGAAARLGARRRCAAAAGGRAARRARPRRLRRAQPAPLRARGVCARSTRSPAPATAPTTPRTGCTRTGAGHDAPASTPWPLARISTRDRLRDWCAVIAVHG